MIVNANVFPTLQTVKEFVRPILKSAVSEHFLLVNIWKDSKRF